MECKTDMYSESGLLISAFPQLLTILRKIYNKISYLVSNLTQCF